MPHTPNRVLFERQRLSLSVPPPSLMPPWLIRNGNQLSCAVLELLCAVMTVSQMLCRVLTLTSAACLACALLGCPPSQPRTKPHSELPTPSASVGYAPDAGLAGSVVAKFDLSADATEDFFALPWPSDLRLSSDGTVQLKGYPGGDSLLLGTAFSDAAGMLRGFSIMPVIYFHFSGPIRALKAGELSDKAAPVALIDVDPTSPDQGKRIALTSRHYSSALSLVPANTLALRPQAGFVLRPNTRYAAVVLRKLGDSEGRLLGTTSDFERTKWTKPLADPRGEAARKLHDMALTKLAKLGMARADIAALTVFRTQRTDAGYRSMLRFADAPKAPHAPKLLDASWADDANGDIYRIIRGYYCTPNFQQAIEEVPFLERGGIIGFDTDGNVKVAPIPEASAYRTKECGELLRARFALTVPPGAVPANGWPLLIYAHGTTGDASSFIGVNNFAAWAASQGIATASTDQPLHGGDDPRGARPGSRKPYSFKIGPFPIPMPTKGKGSELAFYNVMRPSVLRANLRQAAIDAALLARLLLATDFASAKRSDGSLALATKTGRQPPRFDRSKLSYAGHSQGSQSTIANGAPEPLARAVVLSACGGHMSHSMLLRADAKKAIRAVSVVMGLADGELDAFHPLAAAMQLFLDPVDPQSFGRFFWETEAKRPARSVLHFQGIDDSMTVAAASDAVSLALRAQPLLPVLRELETLALLDIKPATSARGNAAGGKATAALVQLSTSGDGHYAVFYEERAAGLIKQFLQRSLASQNAPEIGPVSANATAVPN